MSRTLAQLQSLLGLDHTDGFLEPITRSWSSEPTFNRPLSPSQSHELLVDSRSQDWFSPAITFAQPRSPLQGLELPNGGWISPLPTVPQPLSPTSVRHPLEDNNPPQDRFSPIMISTPTPPFNLSPPHASPLFCTSPPRGPGQNSPAAPPSSVLAGLRDFSISPSLFDSMHHLSPLRSPSSLASSSPPRL